MCLITDSDLNTVRHSFGCQSETEVVEKEIKDLLIFAHSTCKLYDYWW